MTENCCVTGAVWTAKVLLTQVASGIQTYVEWPGRAPLVDVVPESAGQSLASLVEGYTADSLNRLQRLDLRHRLARILLPESLRVADDVNKDRNDSVTVRLTLGNDYLSSLPWEAALMAEANIAPLVVRTVATGQRVKAEPSWSKPVDVLYVLDVLESESRWNDNSVGSRRDGLQTLDAREARRFEQLAAAGFIRLNDERVRLGDLKTLRDKARSVDALHITCHGAEQDGEIVLMAGSLERRDPISATALVAALDGTDLPLVVLAACHSGAATPERGTVNARSIAEQLVRSAGVRAVVAMQEAVLDQSAQDFGLTLYRELSESRSLEESFRRARATLLESHEGATPVLVTADAPLEHKRVDPASTLALTDTVRVIWAGEFGLAGFASEPSASFLARIHLENWLGASHSLRPSDLAGRRLLKLAHGRPAWIVSLDGANSGEERTAWDNSSPESVHWFSDDSGLLRIVVGETWDLSVLGRPSGIHVGCESPDGPHRTSMRVAVIDESDAGPSPGERWVKWLDSGHSAEIEFEAGLFRERWLFPEQGETTEWREGRWTLRSKGDLHLTIDEFDAYLARRPSGLWKGDEFKSDGERNARVILGRVQVV